jgi:hypothetical protein
LKSLSLCLSFLDLPPRATCCPIRELLRGNTPPLPPDWSLLLGDSRPTSEFRPILVTADFIPCDVSRSVRSTGSPARPGLLSSNSSRSCGGSDLDRCPARIRVSASPPLPGTRAPLRCCSPCVFLVFLLSGSGRYSVFLRRSPPAVSAPCHSLRPAPPLRSRYADSRCSSVSTGTRTKYQHLRPT